LVPVIIFAVLDEKITKLTGPVTSLTGTVDAVTLKV
jgi:hypothetical protein